VAGSVTAKPAVVVVFVDVVAVAVDAVETLVEASVLEPVLVSTVSPNPGPNPEQARV
jgi:hypothetical protein